MVGSVGGMWRYPLKSMMGEELDAAELTERGVLGDRAYALIDRSDGKLASAKSPRKWGRLFDCRSTFVRPPRTGQPLPAIQLALPNQAPVASDHPDVEQVLARVLGRPVALVATATEGLDVEFEDPLASGTPLASFPAAMGARGTFFDYAPIHVLTTATLDELSRLAPESRFEARRFRPNLVIESGPGGAGFAENDWVGGTLAIGDEVRLKVTAPSPRCVMTTLAQGNLPNDPSILRTIARHNSVHIPFMGQAMPSVGVYAIVERPGTVRRGDPVRVEPGAR